MSNGSFGAKNKIWLAIACMTMTFLQSNSLQLSAIRLRWANWQW